MPLLGNKKVTEENKVPIQKLEQIVMGCPLPGKIKGQPARRGRPPKGHTETLMRRRVVKQDQKEQRQKSNEKSNRYASFQDTAKNVNISFNPTQTDSTKNEKEKSQIAPSENLSFGGKANLQQPPAEKKPEACSMFSSLTPNQIPPQGATCMANYCPYL